jgi:phage virion morphogenesis protein
MSQTITLSISLVNPGALNASDLTALLEELGDLTPVLEEVVAPALQQQEQEAFQTQGVSIGSPWADNDPRWVQWKSEHGYSTELLHMTGALAASIGQSGEITSNSALIGTNIPYAEKLQEGFSGRAPDGIFRHVPPRIYMDLTSGDAQDIADKVAEFIASRAGIPTEEILVSVS